MAGKLVRHGSAAAVSTLLAVSVSVLVNVVTSGWTWPMVVGLTILGAGWAGFEAWRVARGGHDVDLVGVTPDRVGGVGSVRRRSVDPPWGLLPVHVRGREELVSTLVGLVEAPDGRAHVLSGLGGSGKTTVALAVADRVVTGGVRVWWISARDEASLVTDLTDLAIGLGSNVQDIGHAVTGLRSLVDLVWQRLHTVDDRWLLVVDNADEPELLAAQGARTRDGNGVVRGSSRGLVLVTSRAGEPDVWGSRVVCHPVSRLSDEASLQLLIDTAGRDVGDAPDAVMLVRRLGGLPLALRSAGRYLASTVAQLQGITTVAAYQVALEGKFADLLGQAGEGDDPRGAVMGTWELSLDLLAGQGLPRGREIMRLVGGLAPAPIPADLLDAQLLGRSVLFSRRLGRPLLPLRPRSAAWRLGIRLPGRWRYDDATHTRTVAGLCGLGLLDLIHAGGGSDRGVLCLGAHPVVAQANAEIAKQSPALRVAVAVTTVQLVVRAVDGHPWLDTLDAPWWSLVTPHLVELLDKQAGHLTKPQVVALVTAANEVLRVLVNRGDAVAGRVLAQHAHSVANDRLGPEHPVALESRRLLATTLADLGRDEQAEQEFRAIRDIRVRMLGAEHRDTLVARLNLAVVLNRLGRYDEAEQEHLAVIEICKRVLGPNDHVTLSARSSYAVLLGLVGRYQEAEQEHRAGLAARMRMFGSEHLVTLGARSNLAETLDHLGLYDEAEQEHRAVRQALTRILGPEHHRTLTTRTFLAQTLDHLGRYAEAEQEHRTAFEARTRALGPEHPDTLASRSSFSETLDHLGRYDEAEREQRATHTACMRMRGPDHPDTLTVRSRLAETLNHLGRYEEAEREHRAVLEARTRVLGPQHPDTLTSHSRLRETLDRLGRFEEATDL